MTFSNSSRWVLRPLLAGLLFTGALTESSPAQQLLVNGNLDAGNHNHWNHFLHGPGVVRLRYSPDQGIDGSGCLSIEGLVPRGQREWYQDVQAGFRPGGAVSAGAQVRTENLEGTCWLEVRAIQRNVVLAMASSARIGPADPSGEWRRVHASLKIPEGTESLRVAAVLEGRGTVFFDDFLLVSGEKLPSRGVEATEEPRGPAKTRIGFEGRAAIYQVRASVDLRAIEDTRAGQVMLALPEVDHGQCPFYFQVLSLPADAIREMRIRRPGGPRNPPLLELRLQHLRTGTRITLDLETRILVLPTPSPEGVPDSALESPSWPPQARSHLSQTNLTRSVEDQMTLLQETSGEAQPFWEWLSRALAASSSLDAPALALAATLRHRGIPARLITGVMPLADHTRPVLCLETWLPGPGWIRLLPSPPILAPGPSQLLVFRIHPNTAEMRSSRFLSDQPENAFIEPTSAIQVQARHDPSKGLFLECREVFALEELSAADRKRLHAAVRANWERWITARSRGKGDLEAEFAGQAASQTANLEEMLRFLTESRS